jgi:integrase
MKAANRLMARISGAMEAGVYRREDFFEAKANGKVTGRTPFKTFAKDWLATLTVEHGTFLHYQSSINKIWVPALGERAIEDVRQSHIKTVIAERAKSVSGKTINNDLVPLRAVLEAAVDDQLIANSPADKIKNLKHQKPTPDPFTVDEMERILADMKQRQPVEVWAYFEFAFCTGLRPSEQIIVKWGKVDWATNQLRIDAAKTYGREKGTKTSTIRDVDLTPRAVAALVAMKPATFMKGLDHPIFWNPDTKKIWASERNQREVYFTPTLKRLDIRLRGAVQTRHTYATTALMGGINPAYIARQMGHSTTAMLFQTYSKWIDSGDKGREAAKLAELYAPKQLSPNCPRTG